MPKKGQLRKQKRSRVRRVAVVGFEHLTLYGAEFFTSTSIFKYSITFIDGSDGFLYSKAPLSETCDLTNYNIKVDRAQRTVLNNVGPLHLFNDEYHTHKDRD